MSQICTKLWVMSWALVILANIIHGWLGLLYSLIALGAIILDTNMSITIIKKDDVGKEEHKA